MVETSHRPCVLLLTTVRSYRLPAFRAAAERLGIEVVTGLDLPPELADQWPDALPLAFGQVAQSAEVIAAYAVEHPLVAVLAVDDSGSLLAAAAAERLRLPHNAPAAALAARDKSVMRRLLRDGGVTVPWFAEFTTADDPAAVATQALYPCVVKPVNLNGSRGVMRADSPAELTAAIGRLTRLLATESPGPHRYLVESFIPGREVALEGMLDDGVLTVLALFDKPDPLDGPFFEETIYVTPSRLPAYSQVAVTAAVLVAAGALGLANGPIHAELRLNDAGAWIVEIAGRSIGGLCSQVLRFGVDASLEELILRQAVGLSPGDTTRQSQAAGVMMIPIPQAGLLREVAGVTEAAAMPLIEGVEITARLHYPVTPLPEGDSYLGFIFARGDTPAAVEEALRRAHGCLRFVIEPLLPVFSMQ